MRLTRRQTLRFLGTALALGPLALEGGDSLAAPIPLRTARAPQGSLRLATQAIVQTDPAFISSDAEVAVANAVYDYLVDIDADNRIQPRLAQDWTISDDAQAYTFKLVENATFHDGSPLTAEDVVWTFDRLRDPETGSPTASLYQNIEGIEATGKHEATFRLNESDPWFLFDLSDNHSLVVKAGTTDATDFNGTGPFRVDSYSPENRIVMEANSDYFVEGQPQLGTFELIFFNEKAAALDGLRSGQLDLVWRIPNALFLGLEGHSGIRTVSVATNTFDVIRLRRDREPGDDPRVMKAFRLAANREELFQAVHLGLGAVGNDSPIGPLYKEFHVPAELQRDVQRARELLAEAGFSDGFELKLTTPNTRGRPDLAVLVKEQLAEIGVDVEVEVRPENVYYGTNEWLDANFGVTSWGSRPVPQFYVDVMLVCGAKWNEARYCDEELDRWAKIAGTELDIERRKQAYAEMQRILRERGPLIVPYFASQNAAIAEEFEGFQLKPFPGRTDFRTVRGS